jgi:hypothetical protein
MKVEGSKVPDSGRRTQSAKPKYKTIRNLIDKAPFARTLSEVDKLNLERLLTYTYKFGKIALKVGLKRTPIYSHYQLLMSLDKIKRVVLSTKKTRVQKAISLFKVGIKISGLESKILKAFFSVHALMSLQADLNKINANFKALSACQTQTEMVDLCCKTILISLKILC